MTLDRHNFKMAVFVNCSVINLQQLEREKLLRKEAVIWIGFHTESYFLFFVVNGLSLWLYNRMFLESID